MCLILTLSETLSASFKQSFGDNNAAVASISAPLRPKLARAGIKASSDCLQRVRESERERKREREREED